MDSDDEDDDETEDALKKHTLLSIYYIAHPSPDEEVKRKAELSLAPPTGVTTSAGVVNNHVLNLALSASGSFGDSSRNNNVEDSAADANGKNSAPAAASTGHLLQSHEDDNKTAIEEIMNKLQRNIGEVPTFDIVLNNQMLYFFHDMRYHFALNLTRCGDKASFRRAKAVEKLEVSKLRAKLLKEQQKASVFYLDSSSEDSDDSAAAGAEEESSLHEENDDDDARSVMSINFNQSRGFGSLSRANSSASVTAPLLSPNVPSIAAAPPLQAKSKSSVGRNPRAARPVKTIDAAAPPVSISERGGGVASGKSALLKSKGGRVLPESKAPPNYPITSWAIQLVSFDK